MTEHAEILAAVSDALASSLNVVENIGRLATLVLPMLGEWSIVSLVDDMGVLTDRGSWHVDPARRRLVEEYTTVRLSAFPGGSWASRASATGQVFEFERDVHQTVRVAMQPGRARDIFDELAPTSCAIVPMVARGRSVGLLSVYSDSKWSSGQAELVREVTARAALAIDNSLAYARLAAANQRLALLSSVSELLSAAEDPEVAVSGLARLVVPLLGDWCVVTLLDEDGAPHDVGWAHRDAAREHELAAYVAAQSTSLSERPNVAATLRSREPLVVEHLSGQALAQAVLDPTAAKLAQEIGPDGFVIVPFVARGQAFGVLSVVTGVERGPHSEHEIQLAVEVGRRAAPVLDSARSAHRARRYAESMQRFLLDVFDPVPGLQVATRYRPAHDDREVGGDWYDVLTLPGAHTIVAIGDVMGHDLAAVAVMGQLRTLTRAAAWTLRGSPAEIMSATDDAAEALVPGVFATAIIADLELHPDDGSATFRWSNAGHPPPILVAADGTTTVLDRETSDVPLGVMPARPRHNHSIHLSPGSTVLLYTDGLIERRDQDIGDSITTLQHELRDTNTIDLDMLVDRLLAAYPRVRERGDDVALLALRTDPTPAALSHAPAPTLPGQIVVSSALPPDARRREPAGP